MAPSTFASAAAGSNQQNAQQRDAGSEWYVFTHLPPLDGESIVLLARLCDRHSLRRTHHI
jgi:hypothetical protein